MTFMLSAAMLPAWIFYRLSIKLYGHRSIRYQFQWLHDFYVVCKLSQHIISFRCSSILFFLFLRVKFLHLHLFYLILFPSNESYVSYCKKFLKCDIIKHCGLIKALSLGQQYCTWYLSFHALHMLSIFVGFLSFF